MLLTWEFCGVKPAYIALFKKGSASFIISRSFEEANRLLQTRVRFIMDNIPSEYKHLHPQDIVFKEGEVQVKRYDKHGRPLPSSYIYAIPAGEHKARGVTGTYIVWDEVVFTSAIIDTYQALLPAIQRGGKLIMLSSVIKNTPYKKFFYGLNT